MYKIGITGTLQGPTNFQDSAVAVYINEPRLRDNIFARSIEFHHGMAEGVDEVLGNILYDEGFDVVGHPGITTSGHIWRRGKCRLTSERNPDYFLKRNRIIVDETRELWAFPKERNKRRSDGTWTPIRSGTWATIRYAEKQGKRVVIFWPDGDIEISKP